METLEVRNLLSVYMVTNLNDNVYSSAGDGSLRGEVYAAPSNATIEFSPSLSGGTINLDDLPIKLAHNITIIGPSGGITVNANGQSGVFQVSSGVTASLTEVNATAGAVDGNGGAIINYGNLTLTDCTVSGSLSHGNGGGIANQGGALSLTGDSFNNNETYGNGGAVYNDGGTVTINNTSFTYGFIGGSGAGIENEGGNVTISGSSFTSNSDFASGGAIDNEDDGTVTLSNTSLDDNSATSGGAIFNAAGSTVTVTGGGAQSNSATYGGDIDNAGIVTVTDFRSYQSGAGDGGSIDNSGSMVLFDSSIDGTHGTNGGGVANVGAGTAKLINSTIDFTSAGAAGGAVFDSGGAVTLINCTIAQSTAPTGGGIAVVSSAGPVTVANTLFADNNTTDSGGPESDVSGSVVAEYSLFGSTAGATFLAGSGHNLVTSNPGLLGASNFGGTTTTDALAPTSPAIDAGSDALAVDANGNPLTTDQRGGVFNRISGASVDIGAYEYETFNLVISTTSDENDGNLSAGHLSLREAIEVASDNFAGSNTITFDANVFATPQTITLVPSQGPLILNGDTTITGPAAGVTVSGDNTGRVLQINADILADPLIAITGLTIAGGGVQNHAGGTVILDNCTFADTVNTSTSDTDGGGFENRGTIDATDCTFSDNTALEGGGLDNNGYATLDDCTFADNSAIGANGIPGIGGGINNNGTLTVSQSSFTGNTADFSGGALTSPGNATLTDCDLSDNVSLAYGGAIDTETLELNTPFNGITTQVPATGVVALANCTFTANNAPFGGALLDWSTVEVTNCDFSDNQGSYGGAIDVQGVGGIGSSLLNVTASTFSNNTAQVDGGALIVYGVTTVTGSTFSGDSAAGAGGAVVIHEAGTASLIDNTFTGNSAAVGGAFSNGGNSDPIGGYATLTQCTLSGNTATLGGGGVFASIGYTSLTNCTIADNEAPTGAGLDITIYPGRIDPFALTNTIVAGNNDGSTPDDVDGPITAQFDLIGAASNATLLSGSANNLVGVTNPRLGALGNNGGPTETMPLLPGSPAIDAGSNALARLLDVDRADPTGMTGAIPLTTDARGLARTVGAAVDIGADEYQADLGITLASASTMTYTGGTITYTLTVTDNGPDASAPIVTDALPAGTVLQSWSTTSPGWVLSTPAVDGQVTPTASLSGGQTLAPGDSATLTLTVNVTAPFGAVVANRAAASSTAYDTNLANNTSNTIDTAVGLGVTSFAAVAPNPRNMAVSSVDVTFNEPVNLATFTETALTLTNNGGANLISSAVSVSLASGSTYQINGLNGLTGRNGNYVLTVNATGITDADGNQGQNSVSTSWLMDTSPPTSTISALPARETSLVFPVSATGSDAGSPASGIAYYNIYLSTNGKPWSFWTSVAASSPTASFTAQSNTTDSFYSIAYDSAGNAELKKPAIEASTYVPDLTPPVTTIDGTSGTNPSSVNTAAGAFTLGITGSDPGGALVTYFEVYVSIDGGAYQEVGPYAIPAGPPGTNGAYSATVPYQGLTDGLSHSYSFYGIGLDSAGNVQSAPSKPNVVFSNETFNAPAQLGVTSFTVEHDSPSRSFVKYLDIGFNESDSQSGGDLTAIVNSLGTASPEILIDKYDLNDDASSKTAVSLSNVTAQVIDHAIELNFGAGGIGNSPNTTAADGYYEVDIVLPNGQTSEHHFYRLLGDVDGDQIVDENDLNAIAASIGETSIQGWAAISADVNGDGGVTTLDLALATRSKGRALKSGLSLG
jgi:uncharacterized repeat protein (TIGR01451 family)